MAGVRTFLQSITSPWRQNKQQTSKRKSSLRNSKRPRVKRRDLFERNDSDEKSLCSNISDNLENLEIVTPRLSDLQFKYNWNIKNFIEKVELSSEGLNSSPFTISVSGLTTVWNLSVRCWTSETGARLHNPVVICLNLVKVSSCSTFSDNTANVNIQFGVFNYSLNHFTMGKLEKGNMALKKTNKLSSIGYQSVYINSSNINEDGTVRFGIRLSLSVDDNDEDGHERPWRSGLDSMIDDEETTDMTITCKNKIFKVHKNILSSRSAVISRLLSSEPEECKSSVTSDCYTVTDDESETSEEETRKNSVLSEAYIVTDDECDDVSNKSSGVSIDKILKHKKGEQNLEMLEADQNVIKKFLDFIYTGRFGLYDTSIIESLLSLSDKYQVLELKHLCEESLMENMNSGSVASYLYLGHLHDCSILKASALQFCKENHQNIVKDSQWKRIESEFPCLYLEAISCVDTPELCCDHLKCIQQSGTRYDTEVKRKKSK